MTRTKRAAVHGSPNPQMLDRRQVARALGFRSPSTWCRVVDAFPDFPPPVRLQEGGHPRWPLAQFQRWFELHFGTLTEENGEARR